MGNCASSFVQGVEYYRHAKPDANIPGLMHPQLGDYHIRDIEFSAAFDVNVNKVGKDVSEAIYVAPNNWSLDYFENGRSKHAKSADKKGVFLLELLETEIEQARLRIARKMPVFRRFLH